MEHKRLTLRTTDRISILPLHIIHDHILTSIPDKDVKIMSSLSKTWYHITNSFPYLVFDDSSFVQPSSEEGNTEMYLNYVTQTLERFHHQNLELKSHIRMLKICITFNPRVAPSLDYWIDLALQNGVEELYFKVKNPEDDHAREPLYDLPPSIFASRSIKVAMIEGCRLLWNHLKVSGSSSNLKKLAFVKVVLDEISVHDIISSCPLLEELHFLFCWGYMNRLHISNLPKLKDLGIFKLLGKSDHPILEIHVPSLQNLVIHGGPKKLTHLDLDCNLQDILSRLPSLRSLELCSISRLTKLKLSSCTLNELKIRRNKNLVELEIDAPNLVSADYRGEFASLLASSKHNDMIPWNHVSTRYNGLLNPLIKVEDFLVETVHFFSKKKHMEYLRLSFTKIRGHISFKKLNDKVIRPAENIGNLELAFYGLKKADCINLLDGVFWSCHPRTLSLKLDHITPNDNHNYVVKHICNLMIHYRDGCSCNNARRRWIHHIHEVMFVNHDGTEDRLPMDGAFILFFCRSYYKIKFIFKW